MKQVKITVLILLVFCMSCITVQKAPVIKTYQIEEGNPKKSKAFKKYTKFTFTVYGTHEELYEFLNKNFTLYPEKGLDLAKIKPFFDQEETYNLLIKMHKKRDVDINLINMFSNKNNRENELYPDDREQMNYGEYVFYVSFMVTDLNENDMLAKHSDIRGRLVSYLNGIRGEFIQFKKEKEFLRNAL